MCKIPATATKNRAIKNITFFPTCLSVIFENNDDEESSVTSFDNAKVYNKSALNNNYPLGLASSHRLGVSRELHGERPAARHQVCIPGPSQEFFRPQPSKSHLGLHHNSG